MGNCRSSILPRSTEAGGADTAVPGVASASVRDDRPYQRWQRRRPPPCSWCFLRASAPCPLHGQDDSGRIADAGRTNQQLEGLVGCFNMLVPQLTFRCLTFSQLLGRQDRAPPTAMPKCRLKSWSDPLRQIGARRSSGAISFQNAPKSVEVTPDVSFTASGGTLFDLRFRDRFRTSS